jgi:hypothetical protein
MNNQQEQWRDIEGYGGRYQVSNMGRVRALFAYRGQQAPRLLNPMQANTGYRVVSLYDGSGQKHRQQVHRLVAKAFCDGYRDGLHVNHLDENKQNNRADNLEWVTAEENAFYGTAHDRIREHYRRKQWPAHEQYREQMAITTQPDGEQWAPVSGYEGIYEVSTEGYVRTVATGHIKHPSWRSGYQYVALKVGGRQRNILVHRLVAEAFISRTDDSQTEVTHIDGNLANNRVSNLSWRSHRGNHCDDDVRQCMSHSHKTSQRVTAMVKRRTQQGTYGAEKPVEQIDREGRVVGQYRSTREAAEATGLDRRRISACCHNQRGHHGHYAWRYKEGGSA